MPDSSKTFACCPCFAHGVLGFGLILILAGLIDIAINCADSFGTLICAFSAVLFIINCIWAIVDLIWFIHIRKNGIPVEGRVYNRLKSYGKDKDGNPQYSYQLRVEYDVPRLNTHTKCEAAASAKYEFLTETSSSNEVDEENFTETEQKKKTFNVSEAAYDAVSVPSSIEVLVLPGRAESAVISQNISLDLLQICGQAVVYLFGGLFFGYIGTGQIAAYGIRILQI
eukprot:scaffold10203_cov272-Chaetoceros_neogracile.AAC.18